MSAASDMLAARIVSSNSEGFRADVYDDATGLPIVCEGQPTIGYGCRCRAWPRELGRTVLSWQVADEFEKPLLAEPWYVACNDARRSALLEIAFNQGDAGLERGYPDLIAAVRAKNWPAAAAQCTVKEEALKSRYERIAEILLTGAA